MDDNWIAELGDDDLEEVMVIADQAGVRAAEQVQQLARGEARVAVIGGPGPGFAEMPGNRFAAWP
jgi:hypothetical protein